MPSRRRRTKRAPSGGFSHLLRAFAAWDVRCLVVRGPAVGVRCRPPPTLRWTTVSLCGVLRPHHASRCAPMLAAIVLAVGASCTPSFARSPPARIARVGSVSATAPADPVGPGDPGLRACDDRSACAPDLDCLAPDYRPGSGLRPECEGDHHCSEGMLCVDERCVARCTAGDCGALQRCVDGRCRPRRCDEAGMSECPRNHRCDPGSGSCARIGCQRSEECDEGVCWRGTCFAHGGECRAQEYPM